MISANESMRDRQEASSRERFQELFRLVSGYRVSQALYVTATLGVADLLADGPRSSEDLARATGTHASALDRLLRFLSGVGLVDEVAPHRFALTPLGGGLRADVPDSIRPFVLMLLDEMHWPAWGQLLHGVRTGETAFAHVHGMGFFDYLATHPANADAFQRAMTSSTARSSAAIVHAYDFSGIRRLVDIGGGHGLLLTTILQANPSMEGVLFDQPDVVASALPAIEAAGVSNRCDLVGGDVFAAIPPGGDAYLLRQIIHDWDDARAAAILANCRRAMREDGRLLVIERGIASDLREALPVLHLDLEMLVNLGGLQRTDAEYETLFASAGFRLSAIVPLRDPDQFCIYEGQPATALAGDGAHSS